VTVPENLKPSANHFTGFNLLIYNISGGFLPAYVKPTKWLGFYQTHKTLIPILYLNPENPIFTLRRYPFPK